MSLLIITVVSKINSTGQALCLNEGNGSTRVLAIPQKGNNNHWQVLQYYYLDNLPLLKGREGSVLKA